MEDRRRKSSSGDKFSFPSIPIQDQDSNQFEFGCVTPGSPNSPADHLFFNGRLLPHVFPFQPTNAISPFTRSTSSVSSKDSLMSSRSNSTNSRSSSCSTSARTSTSERRPLTQAKAASKTPVTRDQKYQAVLVQQYGSSSQRWQFITPVAVPPLNHHVSRRRKVERRVKEGGDRTGASSGFCRRLFRSFVSTCKECHAIKPSKRDEVMQTNMELQ